MSLCMHTRVRVCVCCHVTCVCSQAAGSSVCGFVLLWTERCCGGTRGTVGQGELQVWAAWPEGAQAMGLVLNSWPKRSVPWASLAPALHPVRWDSGRVVPGEAQLGRGSVSSSSPSAASEIPSPARRTAPFVLSGV